MIYVIFFIIITIFWLETSGQIRPGLLALSRFPKEAAAPPVNKSERLFSCIWSCFSLGLLLNCSGVSVANRGYKVDRKYFDLGYKNKTLSRPSSSIFFSALRLISALFFCFEAKIKEVQASRFSLRLHMCSFNVLICVVSSWGFTQALRTPGRYIKLPQII